MRHDPVCQAEIDETDAGATGLVTEVEGRDYFFCSPECKQEFDQSPEDFITAEVYLEAENRSPDDFAQG